MRFAADYKFWLVTDPRPESESSDLVTQASLKDLELMFKGGLTTAENPTLFTEKQEAEIEAYGRVVAVRVARVVAQQAASGKSFQGVDRIEILGGDGKVLFETGLR